MNDQERIIPRPLGGRPSNFERFLNENPDFKKQLLEDLEKQGKSLELYLQGEISTLQHLQRYFAVELTRTLKENLLRGKTLVDYSEQFQKLCKDIRHLEEADREEKIKHHVLLRNRDEVDSFMKATCEAIKNILPDIETRKKLIDEMKRLYDEFYIRLNEQHPELEQPDREPRVKDIKAE